MFPYITYPPQNQCSAGTIPCAEPLHRVCLRDQLSGRYYLFSSVTICPCMSPILMLTFMLMTPHLLLAQGGVLTIHLWRRISMRNMLLIGLKWIKWSSAKPRQNLCWQWEGDYGNIWTVLKRIWMSLRMGLLIIEQVKSHKLLGIHKDQDLDFDAQSDALSKSFQRKLDFSSTLVHT